MIFFYISLITYLSYNILKYRSLLISLDEENYNTIKYNKRILKDKKKLLIGPELFLALIIIILCITFNIKVIEISMILAYMILFLYALKNKKGKIKFNRKNKIIIIFLLIIYILLNIWFILDYASYHDPNNFIFENSPLYYIILIVMSYLSPYIILVVNLLTKKLSTKKARKK